MKNEKNNIRDFLYDEPGPKAKRRIIFWTIVSLFPIAFLLYRMAVRFQENGQLAPQYWSFFLKYTTWRFIGQGLLGTLEAALTAGAIAFVIGFLPEDFSCTD